MMLKTPLRLVAILLIATWTPIANLTAQDRMVVPDFTKGDKVPEDSRHDWNLGPTGLRGWIFCDKLVTTDSRQILITKVDPGSPAAETFQVGDVILGVGGKPFSFDPRTELGKAITASETHAGEGKLVLTRWRDGRSEEVAIKLNVLGSYGASAPFDCDKSQRLLDQGCKALAARMAQSDYTATDPIPRSLNALALLASGNPEYLPVLKREAQWASRYSAKSMQTWYYGYCMLFLSEYVLATGDDSVMPGLTRLALEAAKGQSAVGSWGHGFAIPDGRLGGYGMMNSPGVVLTIGLVLAREAGVKDDAVDQAIERSAKLLRFYIGKGSIPYGDHAPWMEGHEDNGKCGMAAVLFNLLGEESGAKFFSRMSVAAHGAERDCGHCGNYFNLFWGMPSVALCGPNASGAWMQEFGAWYFDLARSWDGSYPHQGPPENEHDSFHGFDATGTYLLAYAMPLKKIRLTGAGKSFVPKLDAATAEALIADGRGWDNKDRNSVYDRFTDDQLVARLGSWSPIVRERAAMALGRRREPPVSAIVSLLDSPSLEARYGACQALSKLGRRGASSVGALQECLTEEDLWLRVMAATALAKLGPAAKPSIPKLLELLSEVDKVNDPRGMQQRYLTFALFDGDGMLHGSLEGVDRESLYKAVRAGLKNEDGRARGSLSSVYQNLSARDIKPLLPAIYQAITEPAPSGEMFADGIRVEGLRLFAKHHIEEGIQACVRYARQQNPWESQLRTPELMKILLSYGTHAKVVISELNELANYFEKDEPDFPEELMKQKAKSVRDTIRALEMTIETPELVRINNDPEAKEPRAKEPGNDSAKAPLKVFILAGQSNMEGHAEIRTFDYIGKDPATAPLLQEMRNPDGTSRICDRVWMSYLTGPYDGSANGEGLGRLTTGFGARGDRPTKNGGKIGPEFTFGITMEKELKEPILIIKTAWGGRSLNTEFRPPSAGPYKRPKQVQDEWDKHPQGAHGIPKLEDRKKWQEDKTAASGVFYRMMVEHVKKVLADPSRVCPAFDPNSGYELAGFVWLQGFNDLVDGQTYPNGNYDEYSRLLAHFIRDVRHDLSAPKMPFVIGVLGVDGERNVNFRKAMAAPAAMPEFQGNVVAVDTAPFWDRDIEAAEPKQREYNDIVGTAHTLKADGTLDTQRKWDKFWKPIGKPLPEERNWHFVTVDATESKDKLKEFTDRRFRDISLPAGLANWYMPDFDDSQWTVGKAPIGKGVWKHSGITLNNYSSAWGEEEFLLMRSTFEVDNLDYDSYRLAILARQGFHVYLNGQKIHTYIWWQDKPHYRSIVLDKEKTRYLKIGKNVLAVYANDQYSPKSAEHFAAIDAWVEGITKVDQEKLDLALEEVLSPKDREALKGASNGGYHYFGSAKIFAQMGKAFAEANLRLIKK
ncbi:MAG: DUF6288 domain-containing protein [Pirellula sp.]